MTDTAVLGLREHKRLATRRALQLALLHLALDRGFDAVTVEEVAQVAQVSPRTFFNYFASKEEAVSVDHGPMVLAEAERERFLRGTADPVTDLVHLMGDRMTGDDDLELHRLRRRLMEQESRLLGERLAGARHVHDQLTDLVQQRLGDADRDRAALVVMLSVTVARSGWGRWTASDGSRPARDFVLAALADFRSLASEDATVR